MALFDKNASEIVARIVYAGPPLAGKTETVRVLAKMLLGDRAESAMYSPSEAQGRTLYFDWVSYVGGSFRGNKVRCQIISVPGQDALSERRRHILQEADAVVFVIDSTPDGLRQGRYYFEEIQSWISRSEDEPPIALVVQANKRDLPDALPASEIKQSLGSDRMLTVFETTATAGTGIREAFVMCVSQALARIGKLLDSGRLAIGKPEINSGDDLLTQIEAREKLDQAPAETAPAQSALAAIATTRESSATSLLTRALSSINIAQSSRTAVSSEIPIEPVAVNAHAPTATLTSPPPLLPDGNLHAGRIWPPVA
jgi:signal recognition particle receptor subunit beta